jgi:hypothetical protein
VAAGADDTERPADPHAALRHAASKQVTATAGFIPTLRGCREPVFNETAGGPPSAIVLYAVLNARRVRSGPVPDLADNPPDDSAAPAPTGRHRERAAGEGAIS